MQNQGWFEMQDIRKRNFSKTVWIPLKAAHTIREGKYGYLGFREEFFGTGSIAVPTAQIEKAKELEWKDVGIGHEHCGYIFRPVPLSKGVRNASMRMQTDLTCKRARLFESVLNDNTSISCQVDAKITVQSILGVHIHSIKVCGQESGRLEKHVTA